MNYCKKQQQKKKYAKQYSQSECPFLEMFRGIPWINWENMNVYYVIYMTWHCIWVTEFWLTYVPVFTFKFSVFLCFMCRQTDKQTDRPDRLDRCNLSSRTMISNGYFFRDCVHCCGWFCTLKPENCILPVLIVFLVHGDDGPLHPPVLCLV